VPIAVVLLMTMLRQQHLCKLCSNIIHSDVMAAFQGALACGSSQACRC
jgi:hypothetical protein